MTKVLLILISILTFLPEKQVGEGIYDPNAVQLSNWEHSPQFRCFYWDSVNFTGSGVLQSGYTVNVSTWADMNIGIEISVSKAASVQNRQFLPAISDSSYWRPEILGILRSLSPIGNGGLSWDDLIHSLNKEYFIMKDDQGNDYLSINEYHEDLMWGYSLYANADYRRVFLNVSLIYGEQ